MTNQFPFGDREGFLVPEASTLHALTGGGMTIVATHPKRTAAAFAVAARTHVLRSNDPGCVAAALRTVRRRPLGTLAVLRDLAFGPYRATAKIKNAAVFLKGLALADFLVADRTEHVHAHWLTTPSTVALIAARLAKVPLSLSGHRFDLYADNWLTAKAGASTFVRVISERGAATLRERLPAQLRSRVRVVHLGVDLGAGTAAAGNRAADGPLRILATGFLTEVKGHRYLVDAVARLRDAGVAVTCAIAGEGPLRGDLERRIAEAGIADRVRLLGYVDHDRLLAALRDGSYDVFAHPSIERGSLHEGIPVSMMEAMSFGVPCVASRTGSIPELIDDGCGVLVPQEDGAALAAALAALQADRERLRVLGTAARTRVLEQFAAERTTRTLLDLMTGSSAA